MTIRACAAVAGIVLLAGCQTAQQPLAWARKDGQRMADNPSLAAQGDSDKIQCNAEAASAAGTVQMPTSVTIGQYASGGFGSYRQAAVQNQVFDARMEACMDARGYRLMQVPKGERYLPPRAVVPKVAA